MDEKLWYFIRSLHTHRHSEISLIGKCNFEKILDVDFRFPQGKSETTRFEPLRRVTKSNNICYLLFTMTEYERLRSLLERLSDDSHYLFTLEDFSPVFPDKEYEALKNLLSRAVKKGILERVCRGVYLNPRVSYHAGKVLFHIAAKLRASHFNYLSLGTVLSDAGVISQVPLSWVSFMSSGRTYTVHCGQWGTVEFIHTKKKPGDIADHLIYDTSLGLWRASVELALADMRRTKRPFDLIDWEVANEFI